MFRIIHSSFLATLTVVSLSLLFSAAPLQAIEDPVQLTYGQVAGVSLDAGVTVYRGIPYAAPPVGELRWRPPAEPIPWEGVRPAENFGPACMQRRDIYKSEDCLTLNVWTPAVTGEEKLPVMVWIHGGGWSSGASSSGTYDGAALADKGVVLVSVNYRMNAFGFMALAGLSDESARGVSGNYGILDHIAALEWVRDNVAGFGGDPNNVTVFGESAGAASVYALLATPLAGGLFHKAIAQSTWITSRNVTHLKHHNGFSESAEAIGQRAVMAKLTELGLEPGDDVLTALRKLPASDILELDLRVSLVVDGWVLPASPAEIFRDGTHNVVPLLAGVNDGEGLFFVRPDQTFASADEQARVRLREWGRAGQRLARFYLSEEDSAVFENEVDYNTDSWFARPTREILDAMARTPAASYMYVFTRNLRNPQQRAPHAMELRYVFNTLPESASNTDLEIAEMVSDYWVRFAATGNPNRHNLPPWPAYQQDTRAYQTIGVEVFQGSSFRQPQLDALDRYFNEVYRATPFLE